MPKTGRPPHWILDIVDSRLPYVEPVKIGIRRRITLPHFGRLQIDWLDEEQETTALATLELPGQVVFRPWHPYGTNIVERLAELSAIAEASPEELDARLQIRERNIRQTIESQGRMALPGLILAHLQDGELKRKSIYSAIFETSFELWSENYRLERLDKADELLDGLP